jgi:hypothetical protein
MAGPLHLVVGPVVIMVEQDQMENLEPTREPFSVQVHGKPYKGGYDNEDKGIY